MSNYIEQLSQSCSVLSNVSQEQNEAVWLANRTKGIGGSDVGSICGVNKWSSALQIYLRKTGQYEEEHSAAAKERMHWGHMLEPVVADEFERRMDGLHCVELGCTMKHNDHPFLLANVDRIVVDESDNIVGILECKTANEMLNEEWANGEVPISYYYQVQHYLYILGLNRAWISCLVGGNKFYTYDIFFDVDLYTREIFPKLNTFWNENVLKLQEPSLQPADNEFISDIFIAQETVDEAINMEAEYDSIGDELLELKKLKKDTEAKIKTLEAQVKQKLQNRVHGFSPSYQFDWTVRTRVGVDSGLLKASYPDIYAAVLKETTYRQFGLKRVDTDD